MAQIDEGNSVPMKVDSKDLQIIDILSRDSRASYQAIAKKVKLSHDSVAYRIKKMEKNGIIDKYSLHLNYTMLGYQTYYVLYNLIDTDSNLIEEFYTFLSSNKSIVQIISYSDKWELLIRIEVKNVHKLDKFLNEIDSKYSKLIVEKDIIQKVRSFFPKSEEKAAEKIKLDDKDYQILELLAENSRMSVVEIAEKVKLSSDAIIYRMKKYKSSNLVYDYVTLFNVNKMGYHWYNVLLMMKFFSPKEESKLKEFARVNRELTNATKTVGSTNVLLTVLAKHHRDFHKIVNDLKTTFGDALVNYDTLVSYRELKSGCLLRS